MLLKNYSLERLKGLLILEEGYRQFPYQDTKGILTIGIGRNLIKNGITKEEAIYLLGNDIYLAEVLLIAHVPLYIHLSDVRKAVLIDMVFNLGINKFLDFKNMIAALNQEDYETVAKEMLESEWASQVGERANRLATMMKTDFWPTDK